MKNEYIPRPAMIKSIRDEGLDTRTMTVVFEDRETAESFAYQPGQFVQVSLLGFGEAPISITSSPHRRGFMELTVRSAGKLTRALNQLRPGDRLYLRGPYGNAFPLKEVKGRDLFFVAGGIGLPPLRSVINFVLDHRKDFGQVNIYYGARTPDGLCFKEELKTWRELPGTDVRLTVDKPGEGWKGKVGVVTELWNESEIPSGGVAYVCGPPVMMKFAVEKLLRTGFKEEDVYLTLERHMKCGIGKCGHCNVGAKFVCIDGPVFTCGQLNEFPGKDEAL